MVIAAGSAVADEREIQEVENGLLPAIVIKGQPVPQWTIVERMKHYNVPGVSVVVIKDGIIQWSRGYGVLDVESDARVNSGTLFQAASISKPVAAAGAMAMVQAGQLDLDQDVNKKLKSWQIPDTKLTENDPVTLRGLLSHTAGLNVHGFSGYPADADRRPYRF